MDRPAGGEQHDAPDGARHDAPSGPGSTSRAHGGESVDPAPPVRRERRQVLLRLDPAIHDALARWAADDLRSVNAQIDLLLRRALKDAGRMPTTAAAPPRRGRPRSTA